MIQCEGNYDTVRVEGWDFGRIGEGQQGFFGGAAGVSAPRGEAPRVRLGARMVRLCAIIYALYWQNR